ncbi:MAG TPA: hypothetical protein VNB90_02520 [Cytophagaceae bacterium]|nr:hypothetical protein [Cytophagaceae bacterium]
MKKVFIFIFLFLLSYAGYSQSIDSIIVYKGGGFSGMIQAYKLLKKEVYRGKGMATVKYTDRAYPKKTQYEQLKTIYEESGKLFLQKNGFNFPSNVYYTIEIYSKGNTIKYTWGDPTFEAPKEVLNLYNRIEILVKELKFQTK